MAEDIKKEEKQVEKPLDKMTVVELREVAKEARGIKDEAPAKKKKKTAGPKKAMSVKEMKQEIIRLRAERETLRQEKDKNKLGIIRRRINRLKKMTRRAA
jgi:hypothetical protein